MKEKIEQLLANSIEKLKANAQLPPDLIPNLALTRCRQPEHGDFASNIAMTLAKQVNQNPRDLAQSIVDAIDQPEWIARIEIAGPGFINFALRSGENNTVINQIIEQEETFGHSDIGNQQRIHLEFVSANPTGPLHVGHGRSAAYGASLGNLLKAAGYDVHREYYVNDAGRQMRLLALSTWVRYMHACGIDVPMPNGGYMGSYIQTIAKELQDMKGMAYAICDDALLEKIQDLMNNDSEEDKERTLDTYASLVEDAISTAAYDEVRSFALNAILDDIQNDLGEFGVHYDEWFPESALFTDGLFEQSIQLLKDGGYTYEKDGALWFRATDLGDDKDRILIRSNGVPTYFASDVAYHLHKDENFDHMIDIFGADHHGYIGRLRAFLKGLGKNPDKLTVLLVQFALLYRGKEKVSMSTRGGEFVTLRELRDEVGNDAARFFYIMRKPEQHLDFDLELAKSRSNENPVYYIQYAHARICSIFRKLEAENTRFDASIPATEEQLALLTSEHEQALIAHLADYPVILEKAAKQYAPHHIAHYCQRLAQLFHAYYNAEPILSAPEALQAARLYLLKATQILLAQSMALLGCTCPTEM